MSVIPAPEDQYVSVIVSGNQSRLEAVDTAAVGTELPLVYGLPPSNTSGFRWYVSRHIALKADLPPESAHYYLKIAELVYPHLIKWFPRARQAACGRRLPLVYARSVDRLHLAMADDGINWAGIGGGIAYEYYRRGYMFETSNHAPHNRSIIIQMLFFLMWTVFYANRELSQKWYTYGPCYLTSWHRYDNETLTLSLYTPWTMPRTQSDYRVIRPPPRAGIRTTAAAILCNSVNPALSALFVRFLIEHSPASRQALHDTWTGLFNGVAGSVSGRIIRIFGNAEMLDETFQSWWQAQLESPADTLSGDESTAGDSSPVVFADTPRPAELLVESLDAQISVTLLNAPKDPGEAKLITESAAGTHECRLQLAKPRNGPATALVALPVDPAAPFHITASWNSITARVSEHVSVPEFRALGPLPQQRIDALKIAQQHDYFPHRLYGGLSGNRVGWRTVRLQPKSGGLSAVNLVKVFDQGNNSSAILLTHIDAPQDCQVRLYLNASGRLTAWLNGEQILHRSTEREWCTHQECVVAKLTESTNTLVIQLQHSTELWLFSAAVESMSGKPLYGLQFSLTKEADADPLHAKQLDRALGFINAHYAAEISLESLARMVNVSRRSLSRIFRSQLNRAPMEYLGEVRISRAKELLIHSELSIAEVAYRVGYNDTSYFSRRFSRAVGQAPSAFREVMVQH